MFELYGDFPVVSNVLGAVDLAEAASPDSPLKLVTRADDPVHDKFE